MLENEDVTNNARKLGTEEERNFRKVILKLQDLVLPTTFNLQQKVVQGKEKQIITSMISA